MMHKVLNGLSVGVSLLIIAACAWAFFNVRLVSDHVGAWRFTPGPELSNYQDQLQLTTSASVIFEASRPSLSAAEQVVSVCTQHNSKIVLGCYSDGLIYAFDVDDPQLDGLVQTTLAHELLHAVYSRLSHDRQAEIDALLMDHFDNKSSETLRQQLAAYDDAGPDVIANELHSITPSVDDNLAPELQEHYRTVFTDLGLIRDHFDRYRDRFDQLDEQVVRIDSQLARLGAELDNYQARLTQYDTTINRLIGEIDELAAQIDATANSQQKNQIINQHNAKVSEYRQNVASHNQVVEQHNQTVASYNAQLADRRKVSNELAGLYRAIDPRDNVDTVTPQGEINVQ